ncbi:MAG TPA: lysophospholipid acyltransferase family protein [Thermoanaerobaculia bacterium]|jgi:1-acyl-sn-glycerol-3-phosphate acyltransferase|nr:lysophospholipid acyltransferase family protein [Thermoanaerobaculia bacterium]
MRNAVTSFFRFCLRIFFRRIEIEGLERVPRDAPVIFAVNHPNGLVDPLFLLCFAGRPVSFIAKASLFHTPVIGWFVRKVDSIPVYRKQDTTPGTNEETFGKARAVLRSGGTIAIFPEGTTHDDPQLRELKSGAARIALTAGAPAGVGEVFVIPTGIYYTAKHVFRSAALLEFGEPLRVASTGEAIPEEVDRLTAAIDAGLDAVTVQADSHAALELIARAEDIVTADDEQPLAEELDLRQRFVEGYHYLRTHDPARLEKLQQAIVQFEAELRNAKLEVHALRPRFSVIHLVGVLLLFPVALVGAIVSYPTYLLVDVLAKRFAKGEGAVTATIKVLAAFAFYPLTYLGLAIVAGVWLGWIPGVVTALVLPFTAYVALRVFEDIDDIIGDLRGLVANREQLLAKRQAIRDEVLAIEKGLPRG